MLSPVSSTMSSAFPRGKVGRLPAAIPLETTSCGGIFEVADISLCSGLQVCSPPRSSLPLRILPQGSRGFYVRAERGSLPPRASDMLTARRQAIGGTGTCTPLDCGLVGYSFPPTLFSGFRFDEMHKSTRKARDAQKKIIAGLPGCVAWSPALHAETCIGTVVDEWRHSSWWLRPLACLANAVTMANDGRVTVVFGQWRGPPPNFSAVRRS